MKPQSLTFSRDAPEEVLRHMSVMAERGKGWINVEPTVADETAVPLCTWSPPEQRRRRRTTPVVGIQHHVGRKVAGVVGVPDGWFVVQDNARRGLVVRVPAEEPGDRVLGWLLAAGEALCPVPVTGWAAQVFTVVG